MIGKRFKGDLSEVTLPDILEFLRVSRKTGVLSFKKERIRKSLYLKDGNVIFATSNVPGERLGDLLLSKGRISRDNYDKSVAMLATKKRQGKILVEIGAITPKQLWEGVQDQIRQIVYSLFNWDSAFFYFSEGELPSRENITADVGISELIIEGIRRINEPQVLLGKFPSRDVLLGRMDFGLKDRVKLEPFEKHVLDLIDGQRTASDICRDSEIGDLETIKVLYMLVSIGYIKVKGTRHELEATASEDLSSGEVQSILSNYNRMFSYLYRYMMREVGPIAEHVLNKYLLEIRDSNSSILKNVILKKDGTLDESTITGNLNWIRPDLKRESLVGSLNEFLYSAILAVKRTLGPEHESHVIETLKDVRPEL
ncbi:MAG TPA: DUF4388 domain-containing protein [Acidobacteriota bacterium]|nr:DUF4388 domain-containing protein [Acidobacteriota bacterium]